MLFLQLFLNGIQLGALYALTAIGFSLIFGATRVFHVAHGVVFAMSSYAFYALTETLNLPWYVALVGCAIVTVIFGVLIDTLVYQPIRKHENSFFTLFVGSFGVAILMQNVISLKFGLGFVTLQTPMARGIEVAPDLFLSPLSGIVVIVCVATYTGAHLFLTRSRIGIALRALSDSAEMIQVYGLSPKKLSRYAFVVGSLITVPGALLSGAVLGFSPSVGNHVMLISLAVTIIGGIGSLKGGLYGGFLLGIAESMAHGWFNSQWSEAVTFVVLFIFIIFRPSGFFGRSVLS